eukprot:CAMPEP_0118944020 /NCGR_PEP_ID=MMETSP1169-20130426/39504_1 /TAXON_ID=36882 /ORGANISM="Pyramimonas obovata, Strain CCMP722" /LENGTH=347 /DNA_ID=CAMNT_0006889415 /DNA_START=390 /DNA_END=1433 /DNA_ORIENTATION=+
MSAESGVRRTAWNCYNSDQYKRRANGACVSTRKACSTKDDVQQPGEEIRVQNTCEGNNNTLCSRKVTVIVMTSGKGPLPALLDVVDNYRRMPIADQVLVIWNNPEAAPPPELTELPPEVAPVVVLPQTENTLLNRYQHYAHVRTESVFLTDDDITLCAEALEMSFLAQLQDPERLVTLTLRLVGERGGRMSYMRAGHMQGTHGVAYFMPTKYMHLFLQSVPASVLDFIRTQRPTCEDLALIFMVSNMTQRPPLLLDHHMFDSPRNCCYQRLHDNRHSMSQTMGLGTWNHKRMGCITTWQGMFNHLPNTGICEMVQQCRSMPPHPPSALPSKEPPQEEEHSLFLGDGE